MIIFNMKITDKQIAEEFGITPQTLVNYKNGTKQKKKLYNAMLNALIDDNMIIWEVELYNGKFDYINNSIIGYYTIEKKDNIKLMRIYK